MVVFWKLEKQLVFITINLLVSLCLLITYVSSSPVSGQAAPTHSVKHKTVLPPTYVDPQLTEIASLINQQRLASGAASLERSAELDAIAAERAADMSHNSYYAHRSPSGLFFNDLMDRRAVNYTFACENLNLALNATASDYVNSWLASPAGHKECLLKDAHRYAGYASSAVTMKIGLQVSQKVIVAIYSD